ncbi:MAG: ketopantoate reductase family protein [Bacillaceae bacterium]
MKVLIVGAGATGGYIGGRLIEKGEDVTFLVRANRKKKLEENGLIITSPFGNFNQKVSVITYEDKPELFDLIIIAVKSYHIKDIITKIHPYLHEETMILPFLNGYEHFNILIETLGKHRIIPGLCFIYSTLDKNGNILHTGDFHRYVFGEWNGEISERIQRIQAIFNGANFTNELSTNITYEIWNKYAFIASMSGITTLFQSSIGPILQNDISKEFYRSLIEEICTIINHHDDSISIGEDAAQRITNISFQLHDGAKSSMLQDMEKGLSIEGDHLQGYLLKLVDNNVTSYPCLRAVYSNLVVYETKLSRNSL